MADTVPHGRNRNEIMKAGTEWIAWVSNRILDYFWEKDKIEKERQKWTLWKIRKLLNKALKAEDTTNHERWIMASFNSIRWRFKENLSDLINIILDNEQQLVIIIKEELSRYYSNFQPDEKSKSELDEASDILLQAFKKILDWWWINIPEDLLLNVYKNKDNTVWTTKQKTRWQLSRLLWKKRKNPR